MAYPIKLLLLQKSELSYEVAIRGESPSDNVAGLRQQVTKLTQLYPADEILESVFEFSEDIKGCVETLDKVKNNLDTLKSTYNNSLYNRTKSLLNHLHYRIQRIETPDNPDDSVLLSKVQKSFEKHYNIMLGFSKPVTGDTEPKISVPASENEDTGNINTSGLNISVTCDRGISNDLSKLKYDGKTCVRAFIQRVEEFRVSKGVSDSKMLQSAIDIFTGDALHWYRSVSSIYKDWTSLISHLKEDFDILDFDYRMTSEIRNRTQGDGESIIVYLSIMEGMFSRLSKPLSNEDKLEIILHNIRPCYSNIIAASPNIKSIQDLREVCKNYERIKVRSENYREPPVFNSKMLAPEFCYQPQKRKEQEKKFYGNGSFSMSTHRPFKNDSQFKPLEARVAEISTPYCFRCRVNTHSMRDCTAERTIFCFGCGEKNVRKPDCPKCTKPSTSSPSSKN